MSGCGINWAICKSAPAPHSSQITMPSTQHFFDRPNALPATQPATLKGWYHYWANIYINYIRSNFLVPPCRGSFFVVNHDCAPPKVGGFCKWPVGASSWLIAVLLGAPNCVVKNAPHNSSWKTLLVWVDPDNNQTQFDNEATELQQAV